jgi:acetyltransferase-like isoleucine patch superfamily enzyme
MFETHPSDYGATRPTPRRHLKRFAFVLCMLPVTPLALASRIEQVLSGGETAFLASGQFLGLFPGHVGNYLRLAFYRLTLRSCSLDVSFNFGSTVSHPGAEIGANVSIGAYTCIGTATIGDDVLIGSRVSILSGLHQHDAWNGSEELNRGIPNFERIQIGSHSWIGEEAIIAADIGMRCIVAAGSVVLRAAPDDRLIIGNPARVVSREFSQRPIVPEVPAK